MTRTDKDKTGQLPKCPLPPNEDRQGHHPIGVSLLSSGGQPVKRRYSHREPKRARIIWRVTGAEKARIEAQAAEAGLHVSTFIALRVLGTEEG